MKKSTKALIGTSAAAFGVIGFLNGCFHTRLSKKISDRIKENGQKKNPVDPNAPEQILKVQGDAWVDGQKYDNIVIKNKENKPIHAIVVKADEPSDKWIICIHGYTSSPKGMGSYGLHHHARGYNVLFPNLRGHADSEHKYISMGWKDRFDIICWINYLIDVYGDVKIVLHGASMGAATVMMTSGEDLPENVKCCIADCGYTDVYSVLKNELKATYHLPPFPLLPVSSAICKVIGGYTYKEASCINQTKKSKTPTLFIHGEEDEFVPYRMLDANYNAAACEKEKLSIPDADHANSHLFHPEIYWPEVFKFVDKYIDK